MIVDTLSLRGYFWLPDHEDDKIAGLFTFSTSSGGTLELIGSFTSLLDLAKNNVRDTKRIIGSNIIGDKYFTLDSCRMIALGNSQTFYVGTVVEWYAFDRDEPIECDGIRLELTNVQRWINRTGLEYRPVAHESNGPSSMSVSVRSLPILETRFSQGNLRIVHKHHLRAQIAESDISERFETQLLFDSVLFYADAMDYASDLQDLLTIATHRPSAFERVELTHSNFKEPWEGNLVPRPARLWAEWLAQPKPSRHTLSDQDMTFTFKQVGGIDGVGKWMAVAEQYRTQLGRVMNTRYNTHMFPQDIHLGRVAALESFHTKWPDGIKPEKPRQRIYLKKRLEELLELSGAPFEVLVPRPKRNMWIRRVVDERDDVAHHFGRNLHQDTAELQPFSESAYWLFVMCMLRVADVPEVCLTHMTQHRHLQWCAQQLGGLLT